MKKGLMLLKIIATVKTSVSNQAFLSYHLVILFQMFYLSLKVFLRDYNFSARNVVASSSPRWRVLGFKSRRMPVSSLGFVPAVVGQQCSKLQVDYYPNKTLSGTQDSAIFFLPLSNEVLYV